MIKCQSQGNYLTKTLNDVIEVKFWPKKAQILKSSLWKSQNWKTFRYLSNFKVSEVINKVIWLKVKLIWNEN